MSDWLDRASAQAEENILSIPRSMHSPVGKILYDQILEEHVSTRTHLHLVEEETCQN